MRKEKKKKIPWQQGLMMIFFMLIGAACGVFMVEYLDSAFTGDGVRTGEILYLLVLFAGMYVAMLLQIILHEAGHLVFGLLSGYQFSSFRIGSFMWVKEEGKLHRKRLSLAGTGGQCLMTPPELRDGKIPVILYNLGGSLMNILAALLCLLLSFLCKGVPLLNPFLMMMTVIGLAFAIMNGVPLRLGTVDNDGYNAWSLGKNPAALRSFWVQLKCNEQISKGVRLKNMPDEWFVVPSEEDMKNSMAAVMGVFACNRLMDEHRFQEARSLMERLLKSDTAMVGLHRNLLICDCIYCALVEEENVEKAIEMLDKQQKKFMKSMKKYPSVLRTEYVYALLAEKDAAKAAKVKTQFEKSAKTYPYQSDVESERELIVLAERACVHE